MQSHLSVERMCQLACLSQVSFYRSPREQQPVEEDMEVRLAIQRISPSTNGATRIVEPAPGCDGAA
jgi:hypothetical protein